MLDKNKDFGFVFGLSGVAYEQKIDGKTRLYNKAEQEVKILPDGKNVEVIEPLPEPEQYVETEPEKPIEVQETIEDSSLTIHERLRISDEEDPNYLSDDDIKEELNSRSVKYDKRWKRVRILSLLKEELGI